MIEDIKLAPGLAVIRYKSVGGKGNAVIRAEVPPASRGALTLLTDPTAPDEALAEAGDCWVVQCLRPAVLSLNIESAQPGVQARGSVVVDYLTDRKDKVAASGSARGGKALREEPPRQRPSAPRFSASQDLRLMAHVSNNGDTFAEAGEWLRGDGRQDAIEGLQLPAHGLGQIMMRDLKTGQVAAPGDYLGSRGQFRPLTGLELWLEEGRRGEVICAEALFDSAGFVEASGASIVVQGAVQDDPLLGIKLWIGGRPQASSGVQMGRGFEDMDPTPQSDRPAERKTTGRMKIFRR